MTTSLYKYLVILVLLGACGSEIAGNPDGSGNGNQSVCGNGIIEIGEQCDNGSMNSDTAPNACRTTCRTSYCGDGVIDDGEACDGSNLVGSTCQTHGFTKGELACTTSTCQFDTSGCSLCGNNTAEGTDSSQVHYEICDGTDLRGQDCISIGHAQGVLACQPLTCTWDISGCAGGGPVCGNGILEQGEECDDGNTENCDGCSAVCRSEQCGNGVVDCGEQCDDANQVDGDACTNACTSARCGDGIVHSGVEECDEGLDNSDTSSCTSECHLARCGDGLVWEGVEGCDDGNNTTTDACPDGPSGSCEPAICGDGFVWDGHEPCDTGSDPGCYDGCAGFCGDGIWDNNPGRDEFCDPSVSPSCYSDCSGYCGDGLLDFSKGEIWEQMGGDPWIDCTTISTCGDGICTGVENGFNCHADCPCPGGVAACPDGRCALYTEEIWGAPNCGGCGNTCQPSETCQLGSCTYQSRG